MIPRPVMLETGTSIYKNVIYECSLVWTSFMDGPQPWTSFMDPLPMHWVQIHAPMTYINTEVTLHLSANGHSLLDSTLVSHPGVPGSNPCSDKSISKILPNLFIN